HLSYRFPAILCCHVRAYPLCKMDETNELEYGANFANQLRVANDDFAASSSLLFYLSAFIDSSESHRRSLFFVFRHSFHVYVAAHVIDAKQPASCGRELFFGNSFLRYERNWAV